MQVTEMIKKGYMDEIKTSMAALIDLSNIPYEAHASDQDLGRLQACAEFLADRVREYRRVASAAKRMEVVA